ncbi:MAG: hypothetical protein AAFR52_04235 [Pseudomonadota bacterium]
MTALTLIRDTARARWRMILAWGLALPLVYQVAMLIALVVRFGDLPNYIVFYDWPGNVWRIIEGTPAWSDIPPIVANEWLIEIGYMNYDFGLGISEWALAVVPWALAVLFVMGCLTGLCLALRSAGTCAPTVARSSGAATTLGAGLVLMTNATMSWVVCCATPSWVVGLAMLGLGVSTSLALESLGGWLSGAGFGLLLATTYAMAWLRSRPAAAGAAHPATA